MHTAKEAFGSFEVECQEQRGTVWGFLYGSQEKGLIAKVGGFLVWLTGLNRGSVSSLRVFFPPRYI